MEIEQLVKACQKGDRQAFEELIRLFYPYVSGFLLKLTPDASLAEDLTQETFLKMIRGIDRFDTRRGAGFGTWLVTIARNLYIDAVRRRVPSAELEALPLRDPTDMAAAVDQRLQYEEVLQAMEELPPKQGLAIRLKYVENQTLAEIAERFGVPPNTVKSRIHEGVVKLRRRFHSTERTEQDETKR